MQPTAASPIPLASGWSGAFRDLPREHGYEPLRVEGTIPAGLEGTLFRNGPSLFSSFGEDYRHWFDGDGAVSAVRIAGGRAEGAVRLVQTPALRAEHAAGRRLFGAYGTPHPGGPLARLGKIQTKNAANTSVATWGDRLFALYEGGLPTELSMEDLSTVGHTDLEGAVRMTFSAHPHRVDERRASYNFGMRYGRVTELDLFELPDTGVARRLASLPLGGPVLLHDFIATPRHLVFFVSPVRVRVFRAMLGMGSFSDNLAWTPSDGTEVIVVPLDDPSQSARFHTDAFFQWHFANAFERGGEIVVDLVRYPDFGTNRWLGEMPHGGSGAPAQGRFHRMVLDPKRATLRGEPRWDLSCEFPRVSPLVEGKPYRFAYVASHLPGGERGMFQRITRLDVERGEAVHAQLPEGQYPSEPIFVPKPGATKEDEGWLLSPIYDAASHSSHLAILEADALEKGPIARAWFDHHLPFTFHGFWAPFPRQTP